MKTTVDINDSLLRQAKTLAAQQQKTLKSILEAALRQFLAEVHTGNQAPFRLRQHTFKGKGIQAGVIEGDWDTIRSDIYEGRGG